LLRKKGGGARVRAALGSRGESALWASLGSMKPCELAHFVSVQAKLMGDDLSNY
jgi:hypothetical protein